MTHLGEGLMVDLRDGLADPAARAEARAHLEVCPACRDGLAAAERRHADITVGLAALDAPFDSTSARAVVRARLGGHAARTHRRAWARAAGVVLFLGAASAAAALPRSPVRHWVQALLGSATPVTPLSVPGPAQGAAAASETAGVRLNVAGGPLRVVLRGVAPGTEIDVHWVTSGEAALFAPVGSRFTSATGRLEARLVPGTVRVELPRTVLPTTLLVEGRVYLARTAGGVTVSGPVVRRDAESIAFRTPDR